MALLETQDLTKKFGGFVAVDSVDYDIEEGSLNAIIGPNGAGKTTFFNMLSGTYIPTSGTITFKGNEITDLEPQEVNRRGLARSFQITNLFDDLTVLENVRLGIQSVESRRWSVKYILSKVRNDQELHDKAREIVDQVGLGEHAHQEVNELAHGQKRNLEVAVTASTGAELLLFDEPAAGLTTEETEELLEVIRDIAEGRTVLVVDHDMEFIMQIAEEISVMHQGDIIARGTPEEVQQDQQVKEVYLGTE